MVQLKTRPRKTVEDYMKLPEGVRAELIDGEIFMSPSPSYRHQRIVFTIASALRKLTTGETCISPLDVLLPTGEAVQPDVVWVSASNRRILQDRIRGVPDLTIEVISTDNPERDRIVKREIYARNGVREYWLVDDVTRTVEILRLSGDRYEPHGYFEKGETLLSPLLPDLALTLQEIFA